MFVLQYLQPVLSNPAIQSVVRLIDCGAEIYTVIGIFVWAFTSPKDKPKPGIKALRCINAILVILCILERLFIVETPDVVGNSFDNAKQTLQSADLQVDVPVGALIDPTYTVIGQSHRGEYVFRGIPITLYLDYGQAESAPFNSSTDPIDNPSTDTSLEEAIPSDYVRVPSVVDYEQVDGARTIYKSGLQYQVSWEASEATSDIYYIKGQTPQAGDIVPRGTLVQLELTTQVPAVMKDSSKLDFSTAPMVDSVDIGQFIFMSDRMSAAISCGFTTGHTEILDYLPLGVGDVQIIFEGLMTDDLVLSITNLDAKTGFTFFTTDNIASFTMTGGRYLFETDYAGKHWIATLHIYESGRYTAVLM